MSSAKKYKATFQKSRQRKKITGGKNSFENFLSLITGVSISNQELAKSKQYSVHECQISNNWKKSGLAYIWLSRNMLRYIVVGVYLVDAKCLGLKDTFVCVFKTKEEYRQYKYFISKSFEGNSTLVDCSYELVNNIIYGGIEYAKQFGFEPQKDFQLSQYILGPRMTSTEKVQFGGKDGKPIFIPGPYDDVKEIIQKLIDSVGENGFNYVTIDK